MTKSKTKKKSTKSTKSSDLKNSSKKKIVLPLQCQKAVDLLRTMTEMELLQSAAPAIRDIGIYDIESWSGGFSTLYLEIRNVLFDKDLKLNENLVPVVIELEKESFCSADIEMLAVSLSRIAAILAFIKRSVEKIK